MVPGKVSRTDALALLLIAVFVTWGLYMVLSGTDKEGSSGSDPARLVQKAEALEGSGKIQDALQFYRKAIAINPALCDPKIGRAHV